jgi:U3 small nucleolar RNA-associated protein 20
MRGALVRGFEVQVLYYSLHHLFSAMRDSLVKERGSVDSLAGPLSALLLEDILGVTAAKKEVRQLQATLKEARSTKSFHTFTLLAEVVTFPSSDWTNAAAFQDFMQPVVDMMQFTKRKKDTSKLREVLDRVLVGLGSNESVSSSAVLGYAHNLMSDNAVSSSDASNSARQAKWTMTGQTLGIHAGTFALLDTARRHALLTMKQDTERNKFLIEKTKREEYNQIEDAQDHFAANRVLLAEFGLKLFLWQLRLAKKAEWGQDGVRVARELGPFVALCSRGLHQESDIVATLALEGLRRLLRWATSLPSLTQDAPELARVTIALLQQTDPVSPLGRECLLFLASASKRLPADAWTLTKEEAQLVLRIILQELDGLRDFTSSFSLLQGMLAKKTMCPEMYDIMERVGRLAITHQGFFEFCLFWNCSSNNFFFYKRCSHKAAMCCCSCQGCCFFTLLLFIFF